MSLRTTSFVLAAGLAAVAPAAARADTLESPAPGAQNVAAGGGWQAWSVPTPGGRFQLQVRKPDGTVLTPSIGSFGAPVDPAIGTRGGADGVNTNASRRLSAVYSRCRGTSALQDCDVYAYDLSTGEEERVPALASRTYSETAPSLDLGNWSFVRRGAGGLHRRKGVFSFSERRGLLRLSPTLARETATSQSRTAFTYASSRGFGLQVRFSSGRSGNLVPVAGQPEEVTSPQLTRYRVGWLVPTEGRTDLFQTARFAGSGGPYTLRVEKAPRSLPAGVRSAAGDDSQPFTRYAAADGIRTIDPAIR